MSNKDLWSGFSPDQIAQWLNEAGLQSIEVRKEKDCFFKCTTKDGELVKIPLLVGSGIKES